MTTHYKNFIKIMDNALAVLEETKERIADSLVAERRLEKEFEHHVLLALKGVSKGSGFKFKAMFLKFYYFLGFAGTTG